MVAEVIDSASLAATVLRATEAFVVLVDSSERIIAANPAVAHASGRSESDLVGADAGTVLVVPRDAPDFRHALRLATRRGLPSAKEHDFPNADDEGRRAIAWSVSSVASAPTVIACVGVDVTATRNEFEVLRSRAVTDELTGLPNRAGLLEQLAGMAGTGAAVVFCDLNGFKAVNDSLGHEAGDAVLVQVARRLKQTVRGEDFVARLGGDEFVIVVPPDPSSNFEMFGRRLLRAMRQPMMLPGAVAANVGMSIGMSVLEPGQDPATVLSEADHNMYVMKSSQPSRALGGEPPAT
ncbi:MAG: GGDEF domain-containing protein [Mycobacteriales bacterium]